MSADARVHNFALGTGKMYGSAGWQDSHAEQLSCG